MKRYQHYIEINNLKDATHIEVSITYSKGGVSSFTGNSSPRGFYITVTPVSKENGMISFTMFSGLKQLLLETNRYSDRQFDKAVALSHSIEAEMVSAVVVKNKAA